MLPELLTSPRFSSSAIRDFDSQLTELKPHALELSSALSQCVLPHQDLVINQPMTTGTMTVTLNSDSIATPHRVYLNRWGLLGVFCVVNLFAGSLYSWSIFSAALADKFTQLQGELITSASLGFIFSVASAINPVAMISGGWLNDRIGPHVVMPLGGVMIGGGLFLSSFATNISSLMLTYGLVFGFGVGLTYVSTLGTAMRLFPDRKGLAGGVVCMCYGVSSMVVPVVAQHTIAALGISHCLQLFGLACGTVILVGGLLSRQAVKLPLPVAALRASQGVSANDKNWRQMLATPSFYSMLLLFICGSTAALMLIPSVALIAKEQMNFGVGMISLSVAMLAGANTLGRFVGGTLSDKWGRLPTLSVALMVALAGLYCLQIATPEKTVLFLMGLFLCAWCYGNFAGIFPGFTVEQFGLKYNSINYGIMAAGFSSAGILGPFIIKTMMRGSDFSYAYYSAMALVSLGLILVLVCRVLCRQAHPTEEDKK